MHLGRLGKQLRVYTRWKTANKATTKNVQAILTKMSEETVFAVVVSFAREYTMASEANEFSGEHTHSCARMCTGIDVLLTVSRPTNCYYYYSMHWTWTEQEVSVSVWVKEKIEIWTILNKYSDNIQLSLWSFLLCHVQISMCWCALRASGCMVNIKHPWLVHHRHCNRLTSISVLLRSHSTIFSVVFYVCFSFSLSRSIQLHVNDVMTA